MLPPIQSAFQAPRPPAVTPRQTELHQRIRPETEHPSDVAPLDIGLRIMNDLPTAGVIPDSASLEAVAEHLQSPGIMDSMQAMVAKYTQPGTFLYQMRDKSCLYNVTQFANELQMSGLWSITGKYGVQMNIVKPNDPASDADYYLQLFPAHDEIGFHASSWFSEGVLPPALNFRAQIVRNHGFNIPFRCTSTGLQVGGKTKGVEYLEEILVRPFEVDYAHATPGMQSTLALETGVHFKWEIARPAWRWSAATNIAANGMGIGIAVALAAASGSMASAMFMGHCGALAGQLINKGRQAFSTDCPDEISAWAGTTTGLVDINIPFGPPSNQGSGDQSMGTGRVTDYPRLATNYWTRTWRPNDPEQNPPAADAAGLTVVSTISEMYESSRI